MSETIRRECGCGCVDLVCGECGGTALQVPGTAPEHSDLRARLATIRAKLESIVCTDEVDAGVVLLSHEGPTHYDPELKGHVYVHQYFSPLGDALIELWHLTDPVDPVQSRGSL